MLDILGFVLNIVDQYVIWIYAFLLFLVLVYMRSFAVAHKDRQNTAFTIEREMAAHREGRALSAIGVILGVAMVVTAVRFLIIPTVDLEAMVGPTPTLTLPAPTPTPTPSTPTPDVTASPATAQPTRTLQPTSTPEVVPTVPTPSPVPAACGGVGACISAPGAGATVSGQVSIRGTASIDHFQFYKLEYALGDEPSDWHVIGDVHRAAVDNGVLGVFDTTAFPNGTCWLQVTVVDETGNFPEPYRVRVVIAN